MKKHFFYSFYFKAQKCPFLGSNNFFSVLAFKKLLKLNLSRIMEKKHLRPARTLKIWILTSKIIPDG